VAFSPSGKVLASGGKGNAIVLWDVDTGKEMRQLKARDRNREGPWDNQFDGGGVLLALAFAPDGRHLLASGNVMTLWDLNTGKRVRNYEATSHGGWSIGRDGISVTSSDVSRTISFSADGQTFVVPSQQHGAFSLWELGSVEERGRLEGHENVVLAVRFAPDGKTLVSTGFDGTMRIWDANTLKELQKIDVGRDLVTELAVSPDGQTVALGAANGRIRLWDVKTAKERAAGERPESAVAVGFSADGKSVVSLGASSLRHWDASTGKELVKTDLVEEKKEEKKEPGILRLSADRRIVAQARPGEPIRLLDATTGKEIRALEGKFDQVLHLAMAPDGKTVAAVTMANTPEGAGVFAIRAWDATTGKEIQQLPTRPIPVTALAISADARTVAAAEAGGGFRLWELATGKERRRLAAPARSRFSNEEYVEMRLVNMRMRMNQEEGNAERPCPLTFTPDGKGLAFGEGETIRVWDPGSGTIVRRFACDAAVNGEFAFSPDGRLLAAGGPEHAIWIWNTATGAMLGRLKGHRGLVHRLAFSSDSKLLVSASDDGTALVWDVGLAIASRSQPRSNPTEERLGALWADLAAADAARAYGAIRRLAETPTLTTHLVRERLLPAAAADPQRIARLVADLDDSEFQVRDKATQELEQLHELAAAALEKALAAEPPLEARRRIEGLLQKVQRRQLPSETVRALRAVEVLEAIATPEARQQLEKLAQGMAEARLTKEAKAALERLTGKTGAGARPEKAEKLDSSGR
jgi:WD40 repeat protein